MRIFRLLLLSLFTISNYCAAITIEYGGLSFECEYGCGITESDYQAEELIKLINPAIKHAFERKCWLCDGMGIWRTFEPYEYTTDFEEDLATIEISRYAWEKTGGQVVGEFDWNQNFYPLSKYIQTTGFDLTHSGLNEMFSVIRNDLPFYASSASAYSNQRQSIARDNLQIIQNLEKDKFTAVDFDLDTHKVVGANNWSFIFGDLHDIHDNDDGTYTRHILYAKRQEQDEIKNALAKIENFEESFDSIDKTQKKVDGLLKEIFLYCLQEHQPEGIAFRKTISSLLLNDYFDAIEHLQELLKIAEHNHFSSTIVGKIHLLKGQLQAESTLYGDAIVSLTEAISKNPSLKNAYLERAAAYFELGEFDLSLNDFLSSKIHSKPWPAKANDLLSFSVGLSKGLLKGGAEGAVEFIPNLLSSLHGLGHGLWAIASDPLQTSYEFAEAAMACIQYVKEHTPKEALIKMVPELQELLTKWEVLDDVEKGIVTGNLIGKHGVGLFGGAGLSKGIKAYRELRRANNLLTFETFGLSERHKAFLKAEAIRKLDARKAILKNPSLKIEWDKQGKHLLQHKNFQISRSILEHPDPEALIRKFAGKGIKDTTHLPGNPGYKEIVNFKEFIGYHVERATGEKIPTSWGKIHYSRNGAHIVPTRPRE